jgi:rhodanese-related sulfurtransferase
MTPQEAQKLQAGGEWVIVDVRPPQSHARAAPQGSMSAPLYVPLQVSSEQGGFDFAKGLKALAYAFNGVKGVQPNADFEKQLADAITRSGAKGVVLMCEAGGSLRATPNFPAGKSSRSLQAAFRCLRDGLLPAGRVAHVDGGAAGWSKAGLPFDGAYDASEAGRTPNAAAEPEGELIDAAKDKMGMK